MSKPVKFVIPKIFTSQSEWGKFCQAFSTLWTPQYDLKLTIFYALIFQNEIFKSLMFGSVKLVFSKTCASKICGEGGGQWGDRLSWHSGLVGKSANWETPPSGDVCQVESAKWRSHDMSKFCQVEHDPQVHQNSPTVKSRKMSHDP